MNCENLKIESCPPYASADSLCNSCTGIIPGNIRNNEIKSYLNIDDCCKLIITKRVHQTVISFDGGVTWTEYGAAKIKINFQLPSFAYIQNESYNLVHTGAAILETPVDEVNCIVNTQPLLRLIPGTYLFNVQFSLASSSAANHAVSLANHTRGEILARKINNLFSTAPTAAHKRIRQVVTVDKINVNSNFGIQFIPSVNITSVVRILYNIFKVA